MTTTATEVLKSITGRGVRGTVVDGQARLHRKTRRLVLRIAGGIRLYHRNR